MSIQRVARLAVNEWRFRSLYQKYEKYTMIPDAGLYAGNLHLATKVADVEGVIAECGTWRGGMIAGIADVLGSGRSYYLCDSFQGVPPAREIDGECQTKASSRIVHASTLCFKRQRAARLRRILGERDGRARRSSLMFSGTKARFIVCVVPSSKIISRVPRAISCSSR